MRDFTIFCIDPVLLAVIRRRVAGINGVDSWHTAVRKAQDTLNLLELASELVKDLLPSIKDVVQSRTVMVQNNLYLRAARPNESYDAIGWHRESMYGGEPELFNVWIPVLDVTPENTIKYIPGSADIPDSVLCIEPAEDGRVEKGSDSHMIGLLYSPKRIVDGVDLTRSKPMLVPDGHAAVFPGALIHGAAQNRTDKIRYSVDFRIIAKEHARRPTWREL